MRPLELTIEGFRSYRDQVSFNFEGRGLFGIVGPTGAGKSSILDAMVYALFGKTPRLERETRRLITSGSDEAKVRLVFEVDDTAWDVTRVVRTKGNSPVVLRRFDDQEVVASGSSSVTAKVEEILGLDFKAFTSSVTLPQGEFDRFLKSAPADRARVLKGIFRLDRVDALRDLAKVRRSEVEARIGVIQAFLSSLPEDPVADLEAGASRLDAMRKIEVRLKQAVPREAGLARIIESAQSEITALEKRRQSVAAALGTLPEPKELEDLASLEEAKAKEWERLGAEADAARQALEAAEAAHRSVVDESGGSDLQAARDLVRDTERLTDEIAQIRTQHDSDSKQLESLVEGIVSRRSEVEDARAAVAAAEASLDEVRHGHAAHELRRTLKPGEACPVCEQQVTTVPRAPRLPAVASAEKELARARQAFDSAAGKLNALQRENDLLEERLKISKSAMELKKTEQGRCEKKLVESLGPSDDFAAEIEKRLARVTAAAAVFERARESCKTAEQLERDAQRGLDEVAKKRLVFAQRLIKTCAQLEIESPTFDDDASSLLGSLKRALDEGDALITAMNDQSSGLHASIAQAQIALADLKSELDLPEGETASDAFVRVSAGIAALERDVAFLHDAVAKAKDSVEELEAMRKAKSRLDLLLTDLIDSKFPAFLLDEHRRLLSDIASEKLFALTGRYRFDDDGEFDIVDVINETTRSPDTLSGGETFLASLALALALAEAVARHGGRLDCFFLDEGFGSLDSASLDLALDGIESLAVPGRLIGLISHVGGIQNRVDDLIVLDRADDGTTRVEQTEGPIGYALTI